MYGIVEISGHQYKIKEGDTIDVQRLDGEEGTKVTLDKVLFVGDKTYKVGSPTVPKAKVTAEIVRQGRSRKLIIFKRKKTSGRRTKNGHRQNYTCLKITNIKA